MKTQYLNSFFSLAPLFGHVIYSKIDMGSEQLQPVSAYTYCPKKQLIDPLLLISIKLQEPWRYNFSVLLAREELKEMAQLSSQGSNAIIYLTYAFLLFTGLFLAWKFSSSKNFIESNGTKKGLPLALNFIASGM